MCLGAVLVSARVENSGPEQLFELNVFVICCEDIFLLSWLNIISLLKTVEFVNGGIMHERLDEGLAILWVLLKEKRVAVLFHNHVIDQNGKLVSKALVI